MLREKVLSNIEKLAQEENIREIYLFGSFARGEQDQYSDIDILIVIDDCTEIEYVNYKESFARILNVPISWISLYRIDKIKKMHNYGSYFLWHIKKEGKALYSRDDELANLLSTLPRYKKVESDLKEYSEILSDINNELDNEYISVEYELAVMASLVRNTCIAIAYINGKLDFGRNSAVAYCFSRYGVDIDLKEYDRLYQYRLCHTGKAQGVPKGEIEQLKKWIEVESNLLEIAKGGVENDGKQTVL